MVAEEDVTNAFEHDALALGRKTVLWVDRSALDTGPA